MNRTGNSEPLRVMDVIARLNIGGPAVHVLRVAAQSKLVNHEHRLVAGRAPSHEAEMDYLADELGVTPVYLDSLAPSIEPWKDTQAVHRLRVLMEQFRPHVVHTHTAKAGFVGRLAARQARIPVVVHTFHGHVLRGYFGPVRSRLFTHLERRAAGWSQQLVTLNESLRDELVDRYQIAPRERFTVLPLGLDLEPFTHAQRGAGGFRKELHVQPGAPLVGIVGRLAPVKNPAAFVAAADIVRRSRPEVQFVMVGDGELRGTLDAQIRRLGLQDSLRITGWRHDMPPVYADLDLLVLCSRNEGTPVVLIEALASGCPVVATAEGGVPEFLEHGRWGHLCSADPPRLAEAILESLSRHADLQPVRNLLRERHDLGGHVIALDALYRRLLAAREIVS